MQTLSQTGAQFAATALMLIGYIGRRVFHFFAEFKISFLERYQYKRKNEKHLDLIAVHYMEKTLY